MTLIEIMIVLAIIGAISALLLPRIAGSQDKANVKQAKILIGQVIQSLQMYNTDCGKYPATLDGLTKQDANCSSWGPEPYYKLPKGREAILDPWSHPLEYTSKGSDYVLKSLGKDGAEGGSGYDADISSEDL